MKKLLIIGIALFITNCNKNMSETDLLNKPNPDGAYGDKITLHRINNIGELLNTPRSYLGEDILISGEITEVCPMRGCWIDVTDINTDLSIRVKVTDGKIVFPLSAKGKHVDVQGKFIKLNFTEEQARNWKIHLAKEQGIALKPEDIDIYPTDLVEYRINGSGASIYTYGCK